MTTRTINRAELPWRAQPTDTIDAVRILAIDADGCPYGPVADVYTSDGEGTDTLVPMIAAAPAMIKALLATKALWDRHGLGDDHDASEGTYRAVCQAIANATGKSCPAMFGDAVQPETLMYSWPSRRGRRTVQR